MFILITFLLVSFSSIILCVLRLVRYWQLQRDMRLIVFALNNLCMAAAFGLGGLLAAPHPVYNFSFLLPWARASWGLFALSLFVSVFLDWWQLRRVIHARAK